MSRAVTPVAFAALAVATGVAPLLLSDFRAQEAAFVAVWLIAITGLNVLTGYAGQISLGHGAFMAVGAYTTAILMAHHGVRDVVTIPLAGLVAGAAGCLFAIPAVRLSGLHLSLATFAIAVAAPGVIKKFDGLTGGSSGISLFGTPELTASLEPVFVLGLELDYNNWLYALAWTIAIVLYACTWLFLRGRTGRAFRALRDSEVAATASGVSVARYKTLAFGVSAAYAGVAGSLFAIATGFVGPDGFPVTVSLFLLVGAVVGGLGALGGLIAGAVLIKFLPAWSQAVWDRPGAPDVVYGAILIVLVFLLPGGVSGVAGRLRRLLRRRQVS